MKVGTIATMGVASGVVSGIIKKPIEDAVANHYAPKIAAGEKGINENSLPELAKEKNNFYIPFDTIIAIKVSTDAVQGPYLELTIPKEKLRFLFRDKTQAEVESLAKDFGKKVTFS
jgi:hypothetical protein